MESPSILPFVSPVTVSYANRANVDASQQFKKLDGCALEKRCDSDELAVGDCWLGISLASESGLILSLRVGKHTDAFLAELIPNTEGKTDCKCWCTDDWGGYERVFADEITHFIGKENTQRLERTNGIVRQQTGRWHRRQNKFGKLWAQTEVTARLVVSYFNWIWQHSRSKDSAAQRAGLSTQTWGWHDIATYPTFY